MKTKIIVCVLAVLSVTAAQVLAIEVYVENYSFERAGYRKNYRLGQGAGLGQRHGRSGFGL